MNKTQGKIVCIQGDTISELDLKCLNCSNIIEDDEISDIVGVEKYQLATMQASER